MGARPVSVTFNLPPTPRCVVQRRQVVVATDDAIAILEEICKQLGWTMEKVSAPAPAG